MDANNNHNSKVNDFPEAPASWNWGRSFWLDSANRLPYPPN